MLFELRQALVSYQDYHMLLLTLAGQNGTPHVGVQGAWVVDPGEFDLVLSTEGFGGWEKPTGLLGHVKVTRVAASA